MPRTPGPSIYDIAPRLALAMDQHNNLILARRHRLRLLRNKLVEVERLVAHRDLQLVRAGHTRNGNYIAARTRKLAAAERALARIRLEIDELTRQAA